MLLMNESIALAASLPNTENVFVFNSKLYYICNLLEHSAFLQHFTDRTTLRSDAFSWRCRQISDPRHNGGTDDFIPNDVKKSDIIGRSSVVIICRDKHNTGYIPNYAPNYLPIYLTTYKYTKLCTYLPILLLTYAPIYLLNYLPQVTMWWQLY